jgi:hypothetical protein
MLDTAPPSSPKVRTKSVYVLMRTALSIGPLSVRPMNSAVDVPTPTMVRTPLGTS